MPLTVLSDDDVHQLLHGLTRDELETFRNDLATALHDYSSGLQDVPACAANQPSRIRLCNGGKTPLFMPAQTATATAVKVVTLDVPKAPPSATSGSSRTDSARSSLATPSLSSASTQSTNDRDSSVYSVPSLPSTTTGQSTNPTGTLTLLDRVGTPVALLAAATLTAFRSSSASGRACTRSSCLGPASRPTGTSGWRCCCVARTYITCASLTGPSPAPSTPLNPNSPYRDFVFLADVVVRCCYVGRSCAPS